MRKKLIIIAVMAVICSALVIADDKLFSYTTAKAELLGEYDHNKDGKVDFIDFAMQVQAQAEFQEIEKELLSIRVAGGEIDKIDPNSRTRPPLEEHIDPNFYNDPNFVKIYENFKRQK